MSLAEPRDRRVIRYLVGRDHPEGDVYLAGALDLSGAVNTQAVGVDEQGDHHLRVVGGGATAILAVLRVERPKVHLLDTIQDEPCQVVLFQPVRKRRRHEVQLVTLDGEEVVGHGPIVAIAPGQVVDLTRLLPGALQVADGRTSGIMQQTLLVGHF